MTKHEFSNDEKAQIQDDGKTRSGWFLFVIPLTFAHSDFGIFNQDKLFLRSPKRLRMRVTCF